MTDDAVIEKTYDFFEEQAMAPAFTIIIRSPSKEATSKAIAGWSGRGRTAFIISGTPDDVPDSFGGLQMAQVNSWACDFMQAARFAAGQWLIGVPANVTPGDTLWSSVLQFGSKHVIWRPEETVAGVPHLPVLDDIIIVKRWLVLLHGRNSDWGFDHKLTSVGLLNQLSDLAALYGDTVGSLATKQLAVEL